MRMFIHTFYWGIVYKLISTYIKVFVYMRENVLVRIRVETVGWVNLHIWVRWIGSQVKLKNPDKPGFVILSNIAVTDTV